MSSSNKIAIIGAGIVAMETVRLMAEQPVTLVEITQREDPFAEPTKIYKFENTFLPEPMEYKTGKELRRERRKKERKIK
ncbi:MAG TPA: hypothetical protein PK289_00150 [Bacteroidia bacterium]|nr:hypothetical protein [Bacteroidia bacterium]